MNKRDVAVTGMGLITSLGSNPFENWERIKNLETGISRHSEENVPSNFQYTAKVSFSIFSEDLPKKLKSQMKFLNRGSLLGFFAAVQALRQTRTDISKIPPNRRALYIATGDLTQTGCPFMSQALKPGENKEGFSHDSTELNRLTLDVVNPFFLLESIYNNLFSFLSSSANFAGPNSSLASLSPSGGHALELAYRAIQQNRADVALVVGCGNWITEIPLYELDGLGLLSKNRSRFQSYRPFNKNRDGFVPGEGGSALLLEPVTSAQKRSRPLIAKLRGFGNTTEFPLSLKMGVPEKVIKRSVTAALDEGECSLNDLAFIILHGSGTLKGDRSELSSILDLFEAQQTEKPLCGMKPYTGHMGAASDIAEIIFGIWAIKEKVVPATLNFSQTETAFSKLKISHNFQACAGNLFLSTSYGLGGQTSSIIVESLDSGSLRQQ